MSLAPRPRLDDRRTPRPADERRNRGAVPSRPASEQTRAPADPGPWHRAWLFALNFLKHPLSVGTFLQSSPALVRRLVEGIDWSGCRTVVELGPGVGTISRALLARLRDDARLLLVERNADFVAELRAQLRDPRVVIVHGSAVDLAEVLADEGIDQVDVVLSGIPFSTLRAEMRRRVLDAAAAALRAGGELLVYQHTSHVLPLLRDRFAQVSREIEWRNPVPMRLFRCRQPRQDRLVQPR